MPPKRRRIEMIKVEDDAAEPPPPTGYRAIKAETIPPLERAHDIAPIPPLPGAPEAKKPNPSFACPYRALCARMENIRAQIPQTIKRIYSGDRILLLPAKSSLDEDKAYRKPTYVGDIADSDAVNHPRKLTSMNMTPHYCQENWDLYAGFREILNNAQDDGCRLMSTQYKDKLAIPAVFIEPINSRCLTSVIMKHKQKRVYAEKQWRGFILVKDKDAEGHDIMPRVLLWRVAKVICTAHDCADRTGDTSPHLHIYVTNYGSRMDGERHFRFDRSSKKKASGDYAGCEKWQWAVAGCHGDGLKVCICTFVRLGVEFSLYSNSCRWQFAEHDFGRGEGRSIGKTCMTGVETNDSTQVELRTHDMSFDPFDMKRWYFRDDRPCVFVEGVGELLQHADHRGSVFVKNTHVETFDHTTLYFGYQMAFAKLSRDRNQSGLNQDFIAKLLTQGYDSVEQRPQLMAAIWSMLTSKDATWESNLSMSGVIVDALAQYWIDRVKSVEMSPQDIEGIYPVRNAAVSHDRDRIANMYNARTFRECPPKVYTWITAHGSRFNPQTIREKWERGFLELRTQHYTGWDQKSVEQRCVVLEELVRSLLVKEARCAVKFHLGDLEQVNVQHAGIAWSYDVLARGGIVHIGPFYLDSIHWDVVEAEDEEKRHPKLAHAAYNPLLALLVVEIGNAFGVEQLAYNESAAQSRRDRFQRNAVRTSSASTGVVKSERTDDIVEATGSSTMVMRVVVTSSSSSSSSSSSHDQKPSQRDICQTTCINRCVNCPVCMCSWRSS